SAEDLLQAQRRRRQLIAAVEAALQDIDVLLTASSMEAPCRIDDTAEIARTYGRQARTPFNVTGHPAIALRSGLSAGGLPLALQIAGRFHDEATICRVAAAIELTLLFPGIDEDR
ncbi:amidase family protein, partial [Beijerinckia sp. L45]|uniref:amidase family protein n=1 Tax=Beijerinckia sp. L45 TaxID=1641855 RepID=UPI001FEEE457